jgi:serine/threonine-protein kinase
MISDIGQMFGPYEVLGRVGGGGMGMVLRAWDERLHREVAIKLLYDDYQMPGVRERFLQEARAASKLSHPNICTIFDIGEKSGEPYLVMELLEGETLKEKIARGALLAEEIVAYAKDIAEALAAAHAKGIVHRDIKPANVFLVDLPSGGTQVKVLDFGLAKIGLTEDGGWMSRSLDMTLAGATVGTLAYMSPEQACGQQLDARSDLFSLGVVMYEMATRQIPFRGTTSSLVYTQLLEHDPEPIRKWNESIPKDLERLILKLLAKNRRERFQNAKELRDALAKVEGKLNKGGWLPKKANQTVVPLVPATDPVAHKKRPLRAVGKQERVQVEARTPAQSSDSKSSGDNVLIRPLRLQAEEALPKTTALRASANLSAVAEESGPQTRQPVSSDHKPPDSGGTQQPATPVSSDVVVRQAEFAKKIRVDSPASRGPQKEKSQWRQKTTIIAAASVVVVSSAIFLLVRNGLHPILKKNDSLFVASVQNKTGDAALEGAVLEGLEMDLKQSPYFKTLGAIAGQASSRLIEKESAETASKILAQSVAQRVGAKAYLYGEIRQQGTKYVLSMDVLNTQSNDKLTSITETAESRDSIAEAIDRLSRAVRIETGESGQSVADTAISLRNLATANVDALNAYFAGEKAQADERIGESIFAYQSAIKHDPKFGLAQMKLTWLYRDERAEVESAKSAEAAQDVTRNAGEKTKLLAEFGYEMNATGDYAHALAIIRSYNDRFSGDVDGLVGLARSLRAQGHLVEALLAAQQAYGNDLYNTDAYDEAELALIGLDRYDAALDLTKQVGKLGIVANRNVLAVAYLADKQADVRKATTLLRTLQAAQSVPYKEWADYGRYLDNTGQTSAGVVSWKQVAEKAQRTEGLASASASMLAQGALDNALAANCADAKELAKTSQMQQQGAEAIFNAGMASALCGDKAASDGAISALQVFPHNTLVAQYYLPSILAAQMFHLGQHEQALELLASTDVRVNEPLIFYLRGISEASIGRTQQAVDDLHSVLEHRGIDFLHGGNVYPFAELELSRVLAGSGDQIGSAEAYQRFLTLRAKPENGSS